MLSPGELNRTTLARQLLLARANVPVAGAMERLVGLQAQVARPPYVGLWTRLLGFDRSELAEAIEAREIVKATFLRGTLHLVVSGDYVQFRGTLQPVLTDALAGILKGRGVTVDIDRLVDAAREFMRDEPRSFAELTTLLTGLEPGGDPGAMRYAVRTHLPMVQVPVNTTWSYPGNPRFALADDWLGSASPGRKESPASSLAGPGASPSAGGRGGEQLHDGVGALAPEPSERFAASAASLRELVRRYLAAFGPAGVGDMQTWSYLTNLQPVFEEMRDELVCYALGRGREAFDLPGLTIESADTPAPVRFLPEFDNLLLAHTDRTRVVPKAYRKSVFLPGLRVAATVLIDGYVGGVWATERTRKQAVLTVTPFLTPSAAVRTALEEEGEQLLRFAEPEATAFDVRIDVP